MVGGGNKVKQDCMLLKAME